MKTIVELKEGMKSINDHVRLAAVSAAGKVIVGLREGIKGFFSEIFLYDQILF